MYGAIPFVLAAHCTPCRARKGAGNSESSVTSPRGGGGFVRGLNRSHCRNHAPVIFSLFALGSPVDRARLLAALSIRSHPPPPRVPSAVVVSRGRPGMLVPTIRTTISLSSVAVWFATQVLRPAICTRISLSSAAAWYTAQDLCIVPNLRKEESKYV
jgi:hypothetical protein